MADNFLLQGRWNTEPESFTVSGCPTFNTLFEEEFRLEQKLYQDIKLESDVAESVSFGDVTNANVVLIKTNYKISARFTSADGALQTLPIDQLLYIISKTVPFTAIDLTRLAGQDTKVKVFIGEKAP